MADIDAITAERGAQYGDFRTHAEITQKLKETMYDTVGFSKLEPFQKEALDMIAHKIGRILNGNPDLHDSWDDIAGYAKITSERLPKAVQAPAAKHTLVRDLTYCISCDERHDSPCARNNCRHQGVKHAT